MLPRETDEKIVALLAQDADLSYREMARRLKLNESTLRKRVIALRKRGVIRRFLADIDEEKLGYKAQVMLGIDVDPSRIMEIGKALSSTRDVAMLFNTSGGHDFHAIVRSRNRETFATLLSKISSTEGVLRVTPSFMVERLK